MEVHAVHIPNGSSNGWVKIDHLWALRYGLEESAVPQIVGADLNTPQAERDDEIITFGQERDGSFSDRLRTDPPYTPERPWNSRPWDAGERAVLEGLPGELDMANAFRELHPDEPGFTWGPGADYLIGASTMSSFPASCSSGLVNTSNAGAAKSFPTTWRSWRRSARP